MSTPITRDTLRMIRSDLDAALADVAKKHGVSLSLGTMNFSAADFTVKLTGRVSGAETAEARTFRMNAHHLGIDPAALGKEVLIGNDKYRVVGMKPRGSRVLVERVRDGKPFVSPADQIARQFPARQAGGGNFPALQSYLADENKLHKMFGRPEVAMPTTFEECKPLFAGLSGAMSPENITADGERPVAEVRRLAARYRAVWADLEAIAGRKVEDAETYEWSESPFVKV